MAIGNLPTPTRNLRQARFDRLKAADVKVE
jgi:hypothetical protein